MNKKLLLLTLPALLAMSSCTYLASGTVQTKGDIFAESTEANEEIFGAVKEFKLKRNEPLRLDTLTNDFVKIGYQIRYDDKGTTGEGEDSDDTISIRFVAAIKNANVTAFWKRGIAQENGYEGAAPDGVNWKFKFSEAAKESKKIYTSLTDGENVITAGVEGDYAAYEGFVIYTLTNIPYVEYSDSYLAAYVILTYESDGENQIKSKGLAIKIERDAIEETKSANKFFFDPSKTAHFLEGKINDVVRDGSDDETHKLLYEDKSIVDPSSNYASFSNVDLLANDYFGSFYYSPTNFQFFGFNSFFSKSHGFFSASNTVNRFAAPIAAGNYNLYVKNSSNASEENFVYGYANSYVEDQNNIYFYPGVWKTGADAEDFRMYCWKEGDDSKKAWAAPVSVSPDLPNGKGNMYLFAIDSAKYDSFKFVRMRPGRDKDDWNDGEHSGDNARVWNESSNHVYNYIHTDGPASLFKVNDWNNNSSIVAVSDFMSSL